MARTARARRRERRRRRRSAIGRSRPGRSAGRRPAAAAAGRAARAADGRRGRSSCAARLRLRRSAPGLARGSGADRRRLASADRRAARSVVERDHARASSASESSAPRSSSESSNSAIVGGVVPVVGRAAPPRRGRERRPRVEVVVGASASSAKSCGHLARRRLGPVRQRPVSSGRTQRGCPRRRRHVDRPSGDSSSSRDAAAVLRSSSGCSPSSVGSSLMREPSCARSDLEQLVLLVLERLVDLPRRARG